jgi:C-terminal processing protease CtpA/Prc
MVKYPRLTLAFAALFLVGVNASAAPVSEDRAVENLAAFTRTYGYVRFFYPSDHAAALDWTRFALSEVETVREAHDAAALRESLQRVFQPVAPQLRLSVDPLPAPVAHSEAAPGPITFWQYGGLNLTSKPSIYAQQRVITGDEKGPRGPLFRPVTAPNPLAKVLAPGLVLNLPLALPVGADKKTAETDDSGFAALQARLAAMDPAKALPADWRVRVAGIVTVWTIFQHFHPYLDTIGVRWEDALQPALRRALRDETGADYWATLTELVAQTRDGHGFVYGSRGNLGGLPIRVAEAEGQLVISAVEGDAPFQKGDIIVRVDGLPAAEVLRDRERYASGSPHLSRFRALNQFGEGPLGSTARVEILRGSEPQTVEFTRIKDRRGYFFNSIAEFKFPTFAEVRPGIYYVNLSQLSAPALQEKLPDLAAARGVIFDWRFGGKGVGKDEKMIQPHSDILPHLIDAPIQASPMLIPQLTQPDRIGWTYRTTTWPVKPAAPRFRGRVVWINEPSVVSYGETCMAMIAHYHLATLVGAPTAGTNGNASFIELPGGYRVMWTGMDVRRHDDSVFYFKGFVPDFPVPRTVQSIREGRDEYLEKAIAVLAADPAAK